MKFTRNHSPLSYKDYRKYKPYLQEDFLFQCAYCNSFEKNLGGYETFEIDHHRPKTDKRFKHLECDYNNLYYSCHYCNWRKGTRYPSDEEEARGIRWIDPCKVDPYGNDFTLRNNGTLNPINAAGNYTIRYLSLNSRPALTAWRREQLDAKSRLQDIRNDIQKWERVYTEIWFFYATNEVRETLERFRKLENDLFHTWIAPTPPYPSELSKRAQEAKE